MSWKCHLVHSNYWFSSNGNVIRQDGKKPPVKYNARYLQVYIAKVGWVKLHVLILETFRSRRPRGLIARHLNGNEFDNRPVNLTWGTYSQNAKDRTIHGTQNPPPLGMRYTSKRRKRMRQVSFRRKRDNAGRFS